MLGRLGTCEPPGALGAPGVGIYGCIIICIIICYCIMYCICSCDI